MTQKYEFLVETMYETEDIPIQNRLDELGKNGWMLVSVTRLKGSERNQYIFQRPLPETRPEPKTLMEIL